MKVPRNLDGKEMIKILVGHYGWQIHRRQGSHVTLKKEGVMEILTVPDHGKLRPGLLLFILRKANIEKDDFFEKA